MLAWAITASVLVVLLLVLLILTIRGYEYSEKKLETAIRDIKDREERHKNRQEGKVEQLTDQLAAKQINYDNMVIKIKKKNAKISYLLNEIELLKKTKQDRFKNIVDNDS